MNEELPMWRGIPIPLKAAKELLLLYDCADYIKALKEGLNEPGVPAKVPAEIVAEATILLANLDPYRTK
jgi:hypothetical protein